MRRKILKGTGVSCREQTQGICRMLNSRRKTMKWMTLMGTNVLAIALGVLAFGFGASPVLAQGKSASGGEAGAKVAAINMRVAIANTSEGKQAAAQLEAQFLARRKELEDLNKKINDLQQR